MADSRKFTPNYWLQYMGEDGFSKEGQEELLRWMRNHAERDYWLKFHEGNPVHAFIEFNGLMSKFADICQQTMEAGRDFTMANTHTGSKLVIADHDIDYINEKLECIFQGLSFGRRVVGDEQE